jgi:hypothetical protein
MKDRCLEFGGQTIKAGIPWGRSGRLGLGGFEASAGICCFGHSISRNLQMTDFTLHFNGYLLCGISERYKIMKL